VTDIVFIGLHLAARLTGIREKRLVHLAELGKLPCWHLSNGHPCFMIEDLAELVEPTPPSPPEPLRYPVAPALVVIEQLALEYPPDGSQTKTEGHSTAVVVLSERSGLSPRVWERRLARWKREGWLSLDHADSLASVAHRHVDELWGRGVA